MRTTVISTLLFLSIASYGQSVISSVNSGANSTGNVSYSVGEIFVNPVSSADQANSGLMGVLSRVEFYVGVNDEISSEDVRVMPNPVSSSVFFQGDGLHEMQQAFVYDMGGKLVLSKNLTGNRVDLSELTNGVYIIKTNIESIQSFKIVKQ